MLLGYTVSRVCASPRNWTWFTRLFSSKEIGSGDETSTQLRFSWTCTWSCDIHYDVIRLAFHKGVLCSILPTCVCNFSSNCVKHFHVTSFITFEITKENGKQPVGVQRDRRFYADLHKMSDILIMLLICVKSDKIPLLHKLKQRLKEECVTL